MVTASISSTGPNEFLQSLSEDLCNLIGTHIMFPKSIQGAYGSHVSLSQTLLSS